LVEKRRCEPIPPLFDAPVEVMSLEFRGDLWHRKTRVPGLSYGVVSDPKFSHNSDLWQTDRQTDRRRQLLF